MARNNQNKAVAQVEQSVEQVEEQIAQVEQVAVETETVEQVEQVEQTEGQEPIVQVDPPLTPVSLEGLMGLFKTKSAVIRYLKSQGQTTAQIAKFMGIRYQHVRNVLTQPLKKG